MSDHQARVQIEEGIETTTIKLECKVPTERYQKALRLAEGSLDLVALSYIQSATAELWHQYKRGVSSEKGPTT
jgi:hypothetical protein